MNQSSVLLTIAAVAATAPAAMSQSGAGSIQEPADTVVNLREVAVVAQRADSRTPVAFTNITSEELSRSNSGKDIPFLLQMTPSIVTTSDAGAGVGYTSIRIRGSEGSRINVTANGVPINDSESGNVYWVNMPDLASSLKDVQVQRGAGTSTNGAGAFGGSINMLTDTPSRVPYASLDASYGSYNTHKETLRAGTGLIGGHWAAEARISNIGTDGYVDRATADMYSYFAQAGWYAGASSLRLIAFGGKQRTYMAWDGASREEMEKYGRRYNPCGEYTDKDGNRAYYPDQYDNYVQHHFQLHGRHRFSSDWALDAALHYTRGYGYYEQYKCNRSLTDYGLTPYIIYEEDADGVLTAKTVKKSDLVRLKKMDNDFGGGLFNLTYTHGRVNAVVGGALNGYMGRHFGQVAWVRNYIGSINPLQEYYRNNGHKLDGNVYARANVSITRRLNAFADLQYRHIRYTVKGTSDTYDWDGNPLLLDIHRNYNFFNPKVGVNYDINSVHRFYASWSVAHKEPTRDNLCDADPDRLPTAERMFDYELGYQYQSHILSAGANLYYMDYKDQLVATGALSDTGNPILQNVARSYRAGIELQAALRPVAWFDWQINATLSRNRIKDFVEYIYEDEWTNPIAVNHGSTRIAFSPDFILNNAFNFNYRGFDASLRSHYVSRQYLTNVETRDESLDPYFTTDLVLGYTFKTLGLKSLRIGFTVYNIFNEKYCNNGWAAAGYYVDGGEKVIYRYSGYNVSAPTNVMGSISIDF